MRRRREERDKEVKDSLSESGCGGKPQKEERHTRLRQAFHHMGMGGVCLILAAASLPHFKRINKNSTLNIFHKFAAANNTTLSFGRIQSLSFSHKCQFSIGSVHAATWSLYLNRLCKSFHNCLVLELKHSKQKLSEESHALPLSKALASFIKNLLGITTEPAKYPESPLLKDLFTPLKPDCQIALCSTNILLTFCSF